MKETGDAEAPLSDEDAARTHSKLSGLKQAGN
jgi:hypothetical protein